MITYLIIAVISLSSPAQITEITSIRMPNIEICHKVIGNYVTEALKISSRITRTYLCVDKDESDRGGNSYVTEQE
jgi:hypothetical protein